MKIEVYTGTLVHDVPDCGTVKVALPVERVKVELAYAEQLVLIGQRVTAIKHLREVLKVGLKEAHRMTSEAAERRTEEQRTQLRECKEMGWVTTYQLVGDTGERIMCNTCGYVDYDAGQHRCGACARSFDNEPFAPVDEEGDHEND